MTERYVNGRFGKLGTNMISSAGAGSIDTGAIHRSPLEAEIERLRTALSAAQGAQAAAERRAEEAERRLKRVEDFSGGLARHRRSQHIARAGQAILAMIAEPRALSAPALALPETPPTHASEETAIVWSEPDAHGFRRGRCGQCGATWSFIRGDAYRDSITIRHHCGDQYPPPAPASPSADARDVERMRAQADAALMAGGLAASRHPVTVEAADLRRLLDRLTSPAPSTPAPAGPTQSNRKESAYRSVNESPASGPESSPGAPSGDPASSAATGSGGPPATGPERRPKSPSAEPAATAGLTAPASTTATRRVTDDLPAEIDEEITAYGDAQREAGNYEQDYARALVERDAALARAEEAERQRDTAMRQVEIRYTKAECENNDLRAALAAARAQVDEMVRLNDEQRALLDTVTGERDDARAEGERLRGALERHAYNVEDEGADRQSVRCWECSVKMYGPRGAPRPTPFPHAVGCALRPHADGWACPRCGRTGWTLRPGEYQHCTPNLCAAPPTGAPTTTNSNDKEE